jgi:hypothetical protein
MSVPNYPFAHIWLRGAALSDPRAFVRILEDESGLPFLRKKWIDLGGAQPEAERIELKPRQVGDVRFLSIRLAGATEVADARAVALAYRGSNVDTGRYFTLERARAAAQYSVPDGMTVAESLKRLAEDPAFLNDGKLSKDEHVIGEWRDEQHINYGRHAISKTSDFAAFCARLITGT